MAANKRESPCEFDRLFTKSVPHILDGIFFSLDYNSFVACRDVCKAWNELHSSELYQKMAETLLEEKMNNEKMLCHYSRNGKVEEVGNLLRNGVDPNCATTAPNQIRPLYIASMKGHEDVVRLLLNVGADPNIGSIMYSIMLQYGGKPSIIKLLGGAGAAELTQVKKVRG